MTRSSTSGRPPPSGNGSIFPVDHRVGGPAVIEHPETTVYIGPRQAAVVDLAGNLTIDLIEGH